MNYSNLPPSSGGKRRDENFKVSPVVKGAVRQQRRSPIKHAADIIFSGDRASIKDDIIDDLILPSIRDLIFDSLSRMLEGLFYSRGERRSARGRRPAGGYVSYDNYSNRRPEERRPSSNLYIDDMVYKTYNEASDVLDTLTEILSQFSAVTVADLYDASNMTPPRGYPDIYYGWTDLSDAYVSKVRDGYCLRLPKVSELPR